MTCISFALAHILTSSRWGEKPLNSNMTKRLNRKIKRAIPSYDFKNITKWPKLEGVLNVKGKQCLYHNVKRHSSSINFYISLLKRPMLLTVETSMTMHTNNMTYSSTHYLVRIYNVI